MDSHASDTPLDPMSEPPEPGSGDFVVVERAGTPVEAMLLKNCLEAAGIPAHVGDANSVQANFMWTQALGGVRVLVAQSHLAQAREVIAEFRSGAFMLEGETLEAPTTTALPEGQALWNPDAAALWSMWLTPLFGCALHLVNARVLGHRGMFVSSVMWLIVCAPATAWAMAHMLARDTSMQSVLVASSLLAPLACVWYCFAARPQSQYIVERHGRNYPRRSLVKVLVPTLLVYLSPALIGEFLG
jgi:hypothetical protein